jgi:hypothetical protein
MSVMVSVVKLSLDMKRYFLALFILMGTTSELFSMSH